MRCGVSAKHHVDSTADSESEGNVCHNNSTGNIAEINSNSNDIKK